MANSSDSRMETPRYDNVVAIALPLNPEPWAMGKIQVITAGKRPFPKVAPDKTMKTYEDGLKAELEVLGYSPLPGPLYSIRFSFSRQLAQYTTASGKTSTRNHADVTNMQKSTEDAIQGVLLRNDRDVVRVESRLISEQRVTAYPYVVVEVRHSICTFNVKDSAICPSDEEFSPEGRKALEAMLAVELGSQQISNNEWNGE